MNKGDHSLMIGDIIQIMDDTDIMNHQLGIIRAIYDNGVDASFHLNKSLYFFAYEHIEYCGHAFYVRPFRIET